MTRLVRRPGGFFAAFFAGALFGAVFPVRGLSFFRRLAPAAALLLAACVAPPPAPTPASAAAASAPAPSPAPTVALADLADTDVILLGEQHDAADHHRIEQATVAGLAAEGRLAALALEMAERGHSTAGLPRDADEAAVRAALAWDEAGWPWADYGPVAMAAVRAGVPVLGANLPRAQMREAMADAMLDVQLPGPALKAQQQAIRIGHCGQLPESQIGPMTRIQIARDRAMAQTLAAAAQPGRQVLLVSGAGHADRALGVAQHLPRELRVKAIRLQAGDSEDRAARFDAVWRTPALPARDYCADFMKAMPGQGSAPAR